MTSESVRSIASLPKLEVLTMMGCSLVGDVGLQFLENGCPLLQVSVLLHVIRVRYELKYSTLNCVRFVFSIGSRKLMYQGAIVSVLLV